MFSFFGILRLSVIIQAPDGYYTKECYINPFPHKKYANKYCAFPKLQVQREELDYGTVIKIATHIFPPLKKIESPKIRHTSLRIIFWCKTQFPRFDFISDENCPLPPGSRKHAWQTQLPPPIQGGGQVTTVPTHFPAKKYAFLKKKPYTVCIQDLHGVGSHGHHTPQGNFGYKHASHHTDFDICIFSDMLLLGWSSQQRAPPPSSFQQQNQGDSSRGSYLLYPGLTYVFLHFLFDFIRGTPGFFSISSPEAPERGQLAPYGPRRRKAKTATTTTKAAF